jgi:hypothetical protein
MHGSPAGFPKSPAAVSQSIVLGASRDSAKSHIRIGTLTVWLYPDMALCRFLLADRPAPEARSTSSPGSTGDPAAVWRSTETRMTRLTRHLVGPLV